MKLVIQKVSSASVEVEGSCVGKIEKGFLVFVGIGKEDNREIADQYIKKMVNLRIFQDSQGKTKMCIIDRYCCVFWFCFIIRKRTSDF